MTLRHSVLIVAHPAGVEVAQRPRQVVDGGQQQVLDRPLGGLDRRRAKGRLPMRGEDDPMDTGRLGAPQETADVVRILERVQDEDERGLVALHGAREDVLEAGEASRLDDEGDALVAVEPGEGGQRPAFHLDDRDAQVGRVEDELLERLPSLGHDQQADGRAAGDERFLDGASTGDQLLALAQLRWRWQRRPEGPWQRGAMAAARWPASVR